MILRDILIIGGTGVFGKRLVRHLANREGITLHVTSRSATKAATFIKSLEGSRAPMHAVALDCSVNLQSRLDEIRPFIVIDCSGPFQGANYDTARSVLKAGSHLVDLADARDYLANFAGALDDVARVQGVSALTGASSTPTLSTCVATHLTQGWQRVDTVDMCITPGGKSEVGRSVIEAIMSYAGKDVPLWTQGQISRITGWQNARVVELPGLGRRRVAAVETFDAEYLGPRLNVQSRVSFAAGLESKIEQFGIEGIAALRKRGLMGSPNVLIPLLLKARRITRIPTSSSGGMLVDMCGLDASGVMTQSKWSLIARQDHGPYIPILPAAAAVEKLLSGKVALGASFAHDAVALPDILQEMREYDIKTETSVAQTECSVFERAIGIDAFQALPVPLKRFHKSTGEALWSGEADIEGGKWMLSKALAWLFRFPKPGQNVPVTVSVDRKRLPDGSAAERWTRTFANERMTSELKLLGHETLTERFAPFTFELQLGTDASEIRMPVLGWRLGKLRLPKFLAPQSQTSEYVDSDGRFRFDVRLSVPMIGLLAHYRGWLEPVHR